MSLRESCEPEDESNALEETIFMIIQERSGMVGGEFLPVRGRVFP